MENIMTLNDMQDEPNHISNQVIPIVYATNDVFAKYMSVAIISLLNNADKSLFYDIYILYDVLHKDTVKKILRIEQSYKYCKINFVNVKEYIRSISLYTRAHYSKEMYYRCLIPDVLKKYDKVIYLDGDIIVKSDISKLYNEDIADFYLAAVQNYLNKWMYDYVVKLSINPDKYFNSGVLLLNNKQLKQIDIKAKCFDYVEKYTKLACSDQDILNLICQGQVKYLNHKWNFMWQHLFLKQEFHIKEHKELFNEQKQCPYIIHYTSGTKPWNTKLLGNEFFNLWWVYAKKSPFYWQILRSYINIVYKNTIFSITKSTNHKIITILGVKFKRKSHYLEKIFSVKNKGIHKVVRLFGLKITFKSNKLIRKERYEILNAKLDKLTHKVDLLKK